jgi:CRISPR-associated protein Csm2
MQNLLKEIDLMNINSELFDTTAEQLANNLNSPKRTKKQFDRNTRTHIEKIVSCKSCNKSSQIRRFYEDVLRWDEKIKASTDKDQAYLENLPYIKMLNAKVAYAYEREHVDDGFKQFINHCIRSLTEERKSFEHFKLLFEAVIGFMKENKNH